jgi:hypothetical protein
MNIHQRNPRSRSGAAVVFCRIAEKPVNVVLQARHDIPRLMSHYVFHGESPDTVDWLSTAALSPPAAKLGFGQKKTRGKLKKSRDKAGSTLYRGAVYSPLSAAGR